MALFDYLLKTYCIPLSLWFFLVVVTVYTGLVPCCVPWCPDLHCPSSLCVPLSSLSLHPYAKLTFASIQLCLSVLFSVVLCVFCFVYFPSLIMSIVTTFLYLLLFTLKQIFCLSHSCFPSPAFGFKVTLWGIPPLSWLANKKHNMLPCGTEDDTKILLQI